MIAGVIFDKDGTLFDFRSSWGGWARRLLQDLAGDTPQARALGAQIGYDLDRAQFAPDSPVIAGTPDEIAACLLPHLPGMPNTALVQRMNRLAATAVMAEAVPLVPLMQDLRRRGLKIGLATNDGEAPARAHLAAHGLTDLFDFIAGCDSGHGGKPAPGQLLAFLRQTGLEPARVAMVGDSRHDLQAGRAAGMQTVAVLTGIAVAADLAPLADVVLPDIGALPGWIDARVPA
ncbi:HAD family hydrolase [Fertoebacter nigrum]|uniref:phosphoglycolate phosphatase n=1 Tax=Fertoeibacter niger TaxID=2656921 RepID=A0A8X8KMF1_9RHOB|nr:HAD family hydrolase [Fertoeibacter niger]NUB46309.1 HAD family hydrolase [Fertoeibacter niger]